MKILLVSLSLTLTLLSAASAQVRIRMPETSGQDSSAGAAVEKEDAAEGNAETRDGKAAEKPAATDGEPAEENAPEEDLVDTPEAGVPADGGRITLLPKPAKPAPAGKKKDNNKKKKAKKTPPPPVSEYKFNRIDRPPVYTFDKKTNPIIKEPKPRKKPSAGKKSSAAKPAADRTEKEEDKLDFGTGGGQPPQDAPEE